MNKKDTDKFLEYMRHPRTQEALEKARKETANNPINSYTHGYADGYSKGFIDAIELLMRNEEIWKEISND